MSNTLSGTCRRWYHRIGLRIVVLVVLVVSGLAFGQSCPNPSYPSASPAPMDSTSCSVEGNGGAETAQNEAKNDFCASGAKPITIVEMVSLQKQVRGDKSIPFGNPDQHPLTNSAGPAENRKPLQALGEGSEVVLTGFVKISRQEGAESVNCGSHVPKEDAYHDIHISIVEKPTASECTGVVVEMIPHHRPNSWTADLVNAVKTAKLPVRVTGQLMFDSSHSPCVAGKPVSGDPLRASLWEVHPIYKFEVCTSGDCVSGSGWVPIEEWKK
jgi:hypothetical protein